MGERFPKLHNATWPGVVGKGPDSEPPIDLETMIDLTAAAAVGGRRFDGVDIFLAAPHVDIDSTTDDLKRLADLLESKGLAAGSLVAPVWPPTGGGPGRYGPLGHGQRGGSACRDAGYRVGASGKWRTGQEFARWSLPSRAVAAVVLDRGQQGLHREQPLARSQ